MWRELEPGVHIPMMPVPLLRALVSQGLWLGWPRRAALLAAVFAGLLRPGENLTASRGNLQFPVDVCEPSCSWTFCGQRAPKSRKCGARQQPSLVDLLVWALLWAVVGQLSPSTDRS